MERELFKSTIGLLDFGAIGVVALVLLGLLIWHIKMHNIERKEFRKAILDNSTATAKLSEAIKELTILIKMKD